MRKRVRCVCAQLFVCRLIVRVGALTGTCPRMLLRILAHARRCMRELCTTPVRSIFPRYEFQRPSADRGVERVFPQFQYDLFGLLLVRAALARLLFTSIDIPFWACVPCVFVHCSAKPSFVHKVWRQGNVSNFRRMCPRGRRSNTRVTQLLSTLIVTIYLCRYNFSD